MDYRDLYRHVRQVFVSYWTATPFIFANESEDIPVDPVGDRDSASFPAAWVDVSVEFVEADFLSYDDSHADGFLRLVFWVENGAGEDKLFDLFDDLRSMLATHADSAGGADFYEPRMVSTVEIEDAPFFGREINVPFKLYLAR